MQPLIYAVRLGNFEAVKAILDLGADPNVQESNKARRTPLHYAIYGERLDIFELLMSNGARADIADCRSKCVIHKAACVEDPSYLQCIFRYCEDMANAEVKNEDGATPLMLACQREEKDHVRALLENKVSVSTQDNTGKTSLHYCVENEDVNIAEMVLEADNDVVDLKDNEGYTALQLAVIAGNLQMIKLLLKKRADIKTVDNEGHTLIHWATVCAQTDLIDILQAEGADLSCADMHNAYPLHYAAQMCGSIGEGADPKLGLKILAKLLSKKVDVDCLDQDQRTPLLWAASSGSHEACEALLKAGSKMEVSDKDGLTALHCAASRGHNKCVEILVKKGTNVESLDKNGCTPLFYAVTLGHMDCTKVLLSRKANPSHQDKKGRSPAHCAAAKGSVDALKLLREKKGNLWLQNAKGEYPVHEAALAKQNTAVSYLADDKPAQVNTGNEDGRTSLHIAALTNNLELCKLLLDRKADINTTMTSQGKEVSPYDAALLKGNNECAEYLKSHGAKSATQEEDEEEEKENKMEDEGDDKRSEGEGHSSDEVEGHSSDEHKNDQDEQREDKKDAIVAVAAANTKDGKKKQKVNDKKSEENKKSKKKKVPTATLR